MKKSVMAVLAAVMVATVAIAKAAEDSPFTDFSGEARSIESYADDGKWLVVMIWSHDCHVCNMEAESYAQFHEAHKDQNAHMLGISMDGAAEKADAEAFIERHALPFPNLIGEPEATMLYYAMLTGSQFRGTPTILVYGPDGSLKAAQAGAVPVDAIEKFIANQSAAAS